jgi:conjugal transfer pilus assembly protein TraB
MSESKSLIQRFKDLPASGRTAIIGGTLLIGFLTIGTMMTNDPAVTGPKADVQKDNLKLNNPSNVSATEGVAANLDVANKEIRDQKARIALLEEQAKQGVTSQNGQDGKWDQISNLVAQVQSQQEQLNELKKGGNTGSGGVQGNSSSIGNMDARLPPIGAKDSLQANTPKASSTPVFKTIKGDSNIPPAIATQKEPTAYIPSGSNFEGVLMNGMDAGTGMDANKTPTPALLRIKSEAILPNMFSFNVRECFVMVGGVGNLSTERVQMRTESMSCIDEEGAVWEGKVDGYLVGEDGKAGARGRLVSKQGALLAKTFMAGVLGGIGTAFTAQPVQALNLTSGGTQGYQYPDPSQVVGSGISSGLNKSASSLASFYLKLAGEMFPVLELDAGRKMTVILLKGVSMTKEKQIK